MREPCFAGDLSDEKLMFRESIRMDKDNCKRTVTFLKESL